MEAENLMNLSLLQRRNGTASQSLDLELVSVNKSSNDHLPCYTSLKDILPTTTTTVDSPSVAVSSASAVSTISIRNRLVKQAACAYLHPSTPTPSTNTSFLHRVSSSFLRLISAFFGSLYGLFHLLR